MSEYSVRLELDKANSLIGQLLAENMKLKERIKTMTKEDNKND